jgi:hypothetical protein
MNAQRAWKIGDRRWKIENRRHLQGLPRRRAGATHAGQMTRRLIL